MRRAVMASLLLIIAALDRFYDSRVAFVSVALSLCKNNANAKLYCTSNLSSNNRIFASSSLLTVEYSSDTHFSCSLVIEII